MNTANTKISTHTIPGGICAPAGFRAAGVHCGIRKNHEKSDLAMILCEVECSAASVYTQNKVQGAPITVTKKHLANGLARGILCNSGNANTCNPNGIEVAEACCEMAARATGLFAEDFLVASTGVIGQPLSIKPFETGIPAAAAALSPKGSTAAAEAIMTTDTHRKEFALEFELEGTPCRIAAIGKGSGMINLNMATMLMFLTTDAAISPAMLQKALSNETVVSLNQVCVDGDTSTNDMASILASGLAGNAPITGTGLAYDTFCAALHEICVLMSRSIAADGEGASKLLECRVTNAPTDAIARSIAKSVIASDLLKAAIFGKDANWGRILCAIGYTPGNFTIDNVAVRLKSKKGEILVCRNAAYHPFNEDDAIIILKEKEITILVDMGQGDCSAEAYGCDLTYDYVRINGDYRT